MANNSRKRRLRSMMHDVTESSSVTKAINTNVASKGIRTMISQFQIRGHVLLISMSNPYNG